MMVFKVIVEDRPNGMEILFGSDVVGIMTDREKELISELAFVVREDLRTKAKFERRRLRELKNGGCVMTDKCSETERKGAVK